MVHVEDEERHEKAKEESPTPRCGNTILVITLYMRNGCRRRKRSFGRGRRLGCRRRSRASSRLGAFGCCCCCCCCCCCGGGGVYAAAVSPPPLVAVAPRLPTQRIKCARSVARAKEAHSAVVVANSCITVCSNVTSYCGCRVWPANDRHGTGERASEGRSKCHPCPAALTQLR